MSIWSGSKYTGDYKEGWYHGQGRLEYANGTVYQGEFLKGEYDGEGTLIYPNVSISSYREGGIKPYGRMER